MKIGIFLPFSLMLISLNLQAMDDNVIPGTAGQVDVDQSSPRALQAVIETDPAVQRVLKSCYDNDPPKTANETMSECLWSRLGSDQDRVKQLIQQAQEAEAGSQTATADSVNLNSSVSGVKFKTINNNPTDDLQKQALSKLGDYYSKRLDEAFKATDNKLNVTDQQVFFELAKTQIGKNVITAWSSACLDAGWVDNDNGKNSGEYLVILAPSTSNGSKYQNLRNANIDALKGQVEGKQLSENYFKCVAQLPMLCKKKDGKYNVQGAGAAQAPGTDPNSASGITAGANSQSRKVEYKDYTIPAGKEIRSISGAGTGMNTRASEVADLEKSSQERACEITAYVDGLRRQLSATEKIANIMKDDTVTKSEGNLELGKSERTIGDIDIDRLTTVTSGDLTAEDSYYGAVESNKQLLEECKQNASDPRCSGLVANTDEEKARIRASGVAFMLETEMIKNKINDDAELAKLSLEEKQTILRKLDPSTPVDEGDIDQKIKNLRDAFSNERNALVASLSKKVEQLESSSANDLQSKTDTVADKMLSKGNEYVQLMHFNNVISGYFSVEGGKSNVRVLDLELENVANLENNSGLSQGPSGSLVSRFNNSYGSELQREIIKNNEGLNVGGSSEQNEIINLKSEQIGQFLDYEIDP